MTYAIISKKLSATNFKGTRLKVSNSSESITIPWNYSLDTLENHKQAVRQFIKKYYIDKNSNFNTGELQDCYVHLLEY